MKELVALLKSYILLMLFSDALWFQLSDLVRLWGYLFAVLLRSVDRDADL